MSENLLIETDERGVATLIMNRPEVHNAFDDATIAAFSEAFAKLGADEAVRVLVLTGAGKSFSAGADLNWMRAMAGYSKDENLADAERLADMLHALDMMPKPTVARVNGAALGGAVGLIGACDIAIAADHAVFGVTEVRLGLIPSVISPYVARSMGPRHARRFALTGERFGAEEARHVGLINEVVPEASLDAAVELVVENLLLGAPGALADVKKLFRDVWEEDRIDGRVRSDTAWRIAERRATEEAQEGMKAFFEKRKPGWVKDR
jgi:methylglutaconyl-CoA hydratase